MLDLVYRLRKNKVSVSQNDNGVVASTLHSEDLDSIVLSFLLVCHVCSEKKAQSYLTVFKSSADLLYVHH